jgi:hypothetical protein
MFLALSTSEGGIAWLHAARELAEWKNLFFLEICGRDGKLEIDGFGGFYGVERLTCYQILPGMGSPETTGWEYSFAGRSWETEIAEFVATSQDGQRPIGDAAEALGSMSVIEGVCQGAWE